MKGPSKVVTLEEYSALVGKDLGASDWMQISQQRIDTFADLTNDHQFVHVDPVAAKETPLGTTIAHGFLTLSLVSGLSHQVLPVVGGAKMGMNYGINKLRFVSPVKCGSLIRGRFKLKAFEAQGAGRYLSTIDGAIEIQGQEKPALVLEWLILTFM